MMKALITFVDNTTKTYENIDSYYEGQTFLELSLDVEKRKMFNADVPKYIIKKDLIKDIEFMS